ncbi:MAG: TlpA family protein disulfide reductase [Lysobacterales bacterium]|jgi:peroxiredoxin|nr:MAG: TlpA family protein disulfide reductase [Xanthomonadales bacterium]
MSEPVRPWRRRLLEILVVVTVVAGIQAWRARDLLPADQRTPAPPFALTDLQGRDWSHAALAGRPTVLYFFAPWCGVCAASSPQLRWFHRWRGDDVQVLLVGLDWSHVDELRAYATRHRLGMPVLVGDRGVAADWRIQGYPTYYVIDREGRVARRDVGITTTAGLWMRTVGL